MFHKTIVILFLISLAGIIFQAVFSIGPVYVGKYLLAQAGSAVGMDVSVPVNPYNIVAEQLKNKEVALFEKEKSLAQKENSLNRQSQTIQDETLIYMIVIGSILFLLILSNFYFDWKRKKQEKKAQGAAV